MSGETLLALMKTINAEMQTKALITRQRTRQVNPLINAGKARRTNKCLPQHRPPERQLYIPRANANINKK